MAVFIIAVIILRSCWGDIPECCDESYNDTLTSNHEQLIAHGYQNQLNDSLKHISYGLSPEDLNRILKNIHSDNSLNFRPLSQEQFCPCNEKLAYFESVVEVQGYHEGDASEGKIGGDTIVTLPIDIGTKYNHLFTDLNEVNYPTEGDSLTVAIVDTGLDEGLQTRMNNLKILDVSYDMKNIIDPGIDDNGHGTIVSRIIAKNSVSSNGFTKYQNYKAFDGNGVGNLFNITCAMLCAVENDADLINASFGLYSNHPVLDSVLQFVAEKKIPIVAAQGNDCKREPFFPASHKNALGVIALDDEIGKIDANGIWSSFHINVNLTGGAIKWPCSNWTMNRDFAGPGLIHLPEGIIAGGTSFTAAWISGYAIRTALNSGVPITINTHSGVWSDPSTNTTVQTTGQNTTEIYIPQ